MPVNSGSGRIDIKKTDRNRKTTFYEFKTVENLPPGDFVKQFTRDLVNGDVRSLDQIRWHFEGKALGKKAFTEADKQRLLEEIERIEFDDKFMKFDGVKTKKTLLSAIENNFDNIFKLI